MFGRAVGGGLDALGPTEAEALVVAAVAAEETGAEDVPRPGGVPFPVQADTALATSTTPTTATLLASILGPVSGQVC